MEEANKQTHAAKKPMASKWRTNLQHMNSLCGQDGDQEQALFFLNSNT
jgi:hypothetical protein